VLHFFSPLLATVAQEALGPKDWGFIGGWVLGPGAVPGALVSVRGNGIGVGVSGRGGAVCIEAASCANRSILSIRVSTADLKSL